MQQCGHCRDSAGNLVRGLPFFGGCLEGHVPDTLYACRRLLSCGPSLLAPGIILVVVLQLHAGREAWPSWVLAAHLAALSLARAPGLCTRATPGQEAQPVTEPVS